MAAVLPQIWDISGQNEWIWQQETYLLIDDENGCHYSTIYDPAIESMIQRFN